MASLRRTSRCFIRSRLCLASERVGLQPRGRVTTAVLQVALLGLGACSTAPAKLAPQAPEVSEVAWRTPVLLAAREQIAADVTLLGVRAGTLNFEIVPRCNPEERHVDLVARMSTVGVVRFFKATDGTSRTTMDLASGRPLASELTVVDGDVVRRYHAIHGPGIVDTTYLRTGKEAVQKATELPSGAHALDMQSAFLLLRHWKAKTGERGYFYLLLGRNVWRVLVRYEGLRQLEEPEPASARFLTGVAERVDPEGVMHTRRFAIWLSSGADRIPLRVEGDASFGKVTMRLSSRELVPAARACDADDD